MGIEITDYSELIVNSKIALAICPLCGTTQKVVYPYDDFVDKHKHPIRRYFYWLMTGRRYSVWLKKYYAQVAIAKGKK